jgi:NAD(P)-dependent dehydrogenase (short-subunit alcohol dehydrogenase family)
MDLQLNGRTALVTGSTAGIGLEIARRLVAEGADVVICGRSRTKLDAAASDIGARAVLADPATAEGAAALVAAVPDIDILVNNLGIYEAKPFGEITDEDWRRFFEINVLSGARLARAYFHGMMARDWGRVIFIASESAVMVPPDMIHYGMTKTAQLAISRGLAGLTKGSRLSENGSSLPFLESSMLNPIERTRESRQMPDTRLDCLSVGRLHRVPEAEIAPDSAASSTPRRTRVRTSLSLLTRKVASTPAGGSGGGMTMTGSRVPSRGAGSPRAERSRKDEESHPREGWSSPSCTRARGGHARFA